jgi:predicted nucleic-acid-binding Zn-ribbon protein
MDEDVIEKAKQRMGHSKIKRESYLSNPTIPGMGIDAQFEVSDQRFWHRKCTHCGTFTSADLEFPECVKEDAQHKGYIACKKCGESLALYPGEWVPMVPSNTGYMHGYHWSQLDSVFNDPMDIKNCFQNPPNGNLGDVKRLRLGLPHVEADDQLQQAVVRGCCGTEPMRSGHGGPCAIGVDMGKGKHVVIGIRTGRETYEIIKVAEVATLNDVHDLADRFHVKSAVLDIRPYEDEVRRFQKAETYQVYLSQYLDASPLEEHYDEDTGIVKSDRTQICDKTHRLFTEKRIVIPRRSNIMDDFIGQVCNIAKVLEVQEKTGRPLYRYRIVSGKRAMGDHYRHALNYFLLAAKYVQRVTPGGKSAWNHEPEYAACTYDGWMGGR